MYVRVAFAGDNYQFFKYTGNSEQTYWGVTLLELERMRSLYANGQYQDAYNLYRLLVAMRERDTEPEECLIGGQSAKKLGNLWAAKDALESCLDRQPEGAVLGKARFVLGVVMRSLGRAHEAAVLLTEFIDGLPNYPELRAIAYGPALYDRAIAYQYLGRLDDSWHGFAAACDEFRREGLTQYLCMALHNQAWVAGLYSDSVDARAALNEARPLCMTPTLKWHQRVGEAFLAANEYDALDSSTLAVCQQRALDLCAVIYSHEGDDLDSEARAQAFWLAGKIRLDMGQIDEAYRLAQAALQHSLEVPVGARCLYDAADLLRELHALRPTIRQTGP